MFEATYEVNSMNFCIQASNYVTIYVTGELSGEITEDECEAILNNKQIESIALINSSVNLRRLKEQIFKSVD